MDGRRKGYTMVEVMVAVAIALVIASIAVPFIVPMLSSGNLRAAEDLVKAQLSKARSQAVSESRAYKFGYKPDSNKFRVAPADTWDDESADEVEDVQLPADIQFARAADTNDSPNNSTNKPQDSGDWITFTCYPDGSVSSEDFAVALGGKESGAHSVTVRMRGVTGVVSSEVNRP